MLITVSTKILYLLQLLFQVSHNNYRISSKSKEASRTNTAVTITIVTVIMLVTWQLLLQKYSRLDIIHNCHKNESKMMHQDFVSITFTMATIV